jgi:hypothetical protein
MRADARSCRGFFSSTIRDMQDERNNVVRGVFPGLRRRCQKRQVAWVDLDLRRGVTEAQTERRKVLPRRRTPRWGGRKRTENSYPVNLGPDRSIALRTLSGIHSGLISA